MDCDHYFNNSKALKEAMCFMMDPVLGKKTCYVQFPQRFDGIDLHDRYANRNIVFFDVGLALFFVKLKTRNKFVPLDLIFSSHLCHLSDKLERSGWCPGPSLCGNWLSFQTCRPLWF